MAVVQVILPRVLVQSSRGEGDNPPIPGAWCSQVGRGAVSELGNGVPVVPLIEGGVEGRSGLFPYASHMYR